MRFLNHIDKDEFNHIMLELDDKLTAMENVCSAKIRLLDIYAKQLPSETDRLQGKMRDTILELDDALVDLTGDMKKNLPFLTSEID